jgi:hypothetical protein
MPELQRCYTEQAQGAAYLAEKPGDPGGRLWLEDWEMEEVLILLEERKNAN